MVLRSVLLQLFLFVLVTSSIAQINQSGRNIPYFNTYTSPKAWDGYKSDVYQGSGAQCVNIGGDVPVDMTQGSGALVLESTKPSGYWNAMFKVGWGKPVDYLRMGSHPLLHLRLKWEVIAPQADLTIELHTQENNIAANFPEQNASVLLSKYTQPTLDWRDIYIPISDFKAINSRINLSRVTILETIGQGTYSTKNKMYIEKMEIVPSVVNPYLDAIKINQIGYLPEQQKIGIVSFEKGSTFGIRTLKDCFIYSVRSSISIEYNRFKYLFSVMRYTFLYNVDAYTFKTLTSKTHFLLPRTTDSTHLASTSFPNMVLYVCVCHPTEH